MNRRGFFRDGWRQAVSTAAAMVGQLAGMRTELTEAGREVLAEDHREDFFSNYETSYSLTLAYPREFFEKMAETAGIPHTGRETLEVVRDLFRAGRLE